MTGTRISGDGASAPADLYLYAIGEGELELGDVRGLASAPLSLLRAGQLSGVVSAAPAGKLRPERRHLAAHQGVLRHIMAHTTVLPVGFGMVVPNESKALGMLLSEEETLLEQLESVRGRVEMSVRVVWDVPNIFQHFIEREPDLRGARDEMLRTGNHHSKVELGRLFERIIAHQREAASVRLQEVVATVADDICVDNPKSDSEVARVAALVARERMGEFEERVLEVAEGFDASYRFDLSGPWAPHSFSTMHLHVGSAAEAA